MGDIPYIQAALEVKITGQDPTGVTVNYVSADSNGNILAKDYATSATGSAVPTNTSFVGGKNPSNNLVGLITDVSSNLFVNLATAIPAGANNIGSVNQGTSPWVVGYSDNIPVSQNITVVDTGTTTVVGANGQVFYLGTPSANSTAIFSLSSIATATIEATLLGGGGTMVVEISQDGGALWVRPNAYQIGTQSYTNSFTAPFLAELNVTGMTNLRVRAITSWSGTATVMVKESLNQRSIVIAESLPSGSNTIGGINQSGTWNINNISGTISLPTGAATSTNQSTEITSLQLIDNPIGSVGAGTAGTNSYLIGGVFNTSLPTLTNTQQSAIQLDSSGRLIIAPLGNTNTVKAQLQDNSGNGITSTTINSKQRLDVDLASEAADGSTAPFNTLQVGGRDPNGNLQALITVPSGELFVRDVLNVSAQYRAQSVTTSAAEALGAGTILVNRKLLHVTPTNGTIYWGYTSGVTTATGSPLFPNNTLWLSVTDDVHVYIISAGTVDCRIGELS